MTPNGKIKFREDYWNGLHRENLFQEILFFSGFFLCVLLLRLSSCTMRTKNRKIKLRLTFGFVRFLGGSKGNIEEKIWYKEKWVWQSAKHKNKNPKTSTKYVGQSWRNVMMKKKKRPDNFWKNCLFVTVIIIITVLHYYFAYLKGRDSLKQKLEIFAEQIFAFGRSKK